MLTGLSWARSSSPTTALPTPQTLTGSVPRALTVSSHVAHLLDGEEQPVALPARGALDAEEAGLLEAVGRGVVGVEGRTDLTVVLVVAVSSSPSRS